MQKTREIRDVLNDDWFGINFVPHLPKGYDGASQMIIKDASLRVELPPGRTRIDTENKALSPWTEANYSTLHFLIESQSFVIRAKQFFYDWAPLAAGAPCLWESERVTPFVGEDHCIIWLGTDYSKRHGASLLRNGTLIELSLLKGSIETDCFVELIDGMRPIGRESLNALNQPFFERCYWTRYKIKGLKVPHGLLKFQRKYAFELSSNLTKSHVTENLQFPDSIADFDFDSAIEIAQQETVIIYSKKDRSNYLWITLDHPQEEQFLMEKDTHPVHIMTQKVLSGYDVFLASNHTDFGPHEAHWSNKVHHVHVWSCTANHFSFDDFINLMGEITSKNY